MSDAVIVEAVRSPGGRYKRGGLGANPGGCHRYPGDEGASSAKVPGMKPEEVD